ncbi:MAG: thioredoxin [Nanoarchaeota archaeon]|nr:thioredoxin [Nanoarchaeota archaeon]
MATKQLTLENYEEEVENSSVPSVVDFYADWCGPCQMMKPVFEGLSKEFEGKMNFLKLDTQAQEGLAMKFEIQGIPTLVFLNKGEEVARHVGYASEDMLKSKIDSVLKSM